MPDAKVPLFSRSGPQEEGPRRDGLHTWRSRPAIVALIVTSTAVMGIVLVAMWTERRPATEPQIGQIELLTMRNELAGDTLVVVGIVHVAGLEAEEVAAVISTYGPQGQLMGRGESQLRPADTAERMFRITVAGSAAAVRYHVSFRTPGGGLVRHLDRRGAARPAPVPAGATFIHERSRGRRETRG